MRKKIVAGNWKMNTLPAEGVELAKGVAAGRGEVCSCVNFIVCPPFTHLAMVAEALKGSDVALGAQDCATEAKGAYTGEVAASDDRGAGLQIRDPRPLGAPPVLRRDLRDAQQEDGAGLCKRADPRSTASARTSTSARPANTSTW